ncbi:peptidoglycan recognition protein family protein [Allokutzneria sp. A3M-2-11 16]|uniref:peptidoglycan recognition protein family protein n=1 Tax=Allokutzneria sp. A3M-2-11 16 TaxID=2962043 RepID=UPI0020B900A6|nr:peptidoglycan recognition family protein [Allokutzneria sp. A3M-2-11 16]MCP3802752.1 peptidoglycan recognition protein family protein [Allokutzneria sp. A3M-2-11 16]
MTTRRALLGGIVAAAGALAVGAGATAKPRARNAGGLTPPGRSDLAITARKRAAWGANEAVRVKPDGSEQWPLRFSPVQGLVVHHSALPVEADRDATMRGIHDLHAVRRQWADIGYHLIIDPEGVVYEGRYSGRDPVPVFDAHPVQGRKPLVVTGGHVSGHNMGNIGICLLGDMTAVQPGAGARSSLVRTLAGLSLLCGVDPAGSFEYVNPDNGARVTKPVISRHRDWVGTACPGEAFAAQFDTVRAEVVRLVKGHRAR